MEQYIRTLLLVLTMLLSMIGSAEAQTVQFPLDSYVLTTEECDFKRECALPGLHLAEDLNGSAGTPVYAPADGVVRDASVHTLLGLNILIESDINGETVVFLMGHLRLIDKQVSTGYWVTKGQLLGYLGQDMGDDDEDRLSPYDNGGWTPHLHFGVHKGAYEEPYGGTACDGEWNYQGYAELDCVFDDWYDPTDFISSHQLDCSTYASTFTSAKSAYGSMIGSKTGSPYLYGGLCAQDYDDSGTTDGSSSILFDASGEANQAYLVRSGLWNHYDNVCGGPDGDCADSVEVNQCGPPIGDEYYNGTTTRNNITYGTARQDFQTCYLYWNGSVASSEFYPEVAPGWFDGSGWQGEISYAFAEAYARNDSRNDMGEAVEQYGNPAGVHHWGNNSSLPYVQDFNGGTYGWSILMYNEDLESAFAIRDGFWDTYQDDGPGTFGAPCADEQPISGGSIQHFEYVTMKWKSSTSAVNYSYSSEDCLAYSIQANTETGLDWDNDTYSEAEGDCDDTADHTYPGAPELWDGVDNDCNDIIDEAFDRDGDGYSYNQGDCNELTNSQNPGMPELTDGIDNDCNGSIDEDANIDLDGDGYSYNQGDCNELTNSQHPGLPELTDGIDNDCDGLTDEDATIDLDGDGYSYNQGDCDETRNAVHIYAPELIDGLDNDCDGDIDEAPPYEDFEDYTITAVPSGNYLDFTVQAISGTGLEYVDFQGDMSLCNGDGGRTPQIEFTLDYATTSFGLTPQSLSYTGYLLGYRNDSFVQYLALPASHNGTFTQVTFSGPVDTVVFDATVTDSICVGYVEYGP